MRIVEHQDCREVVILDGVFGMFGKDSSLYSSHQQCTFTVELILPSRSAERINNKYILVESTEHIYFVVNVLMYFIGKRMKKIVRFKTHTISKYLLLSKAIEN